MSSAVMDDVFPDTIPDVPTNPVAAMCGHHPDTSVILSLENSVRISSGAFGVVYKSSLVAFETAKLMNSESLEIFPSRMLENNIVALKKVLQDERYKNRELQILRILDHDNVIKLKYFFYQKEREATYLYLIFDFFPMNLSQFYREYHTTNGSFDSSLLRKIMRGMMCGLDYIHKLGITHRDIKPHNLLYDPSFYKTVLTDFGSAKHLIRGQKSISYICSRHYRAPELILGNVNYTSSIDIWSAACVMGEIIRGRTLFFAEDNTKMITEIIRILGAPSRSDLHSMNPDTNVKFFNIRPITLRGIITDKKWTDALEFLNSTLVYSPDRRPTAEELLFHPYLRSTN